MCETGLSFWNIAKIVNIQNCAELSHATSHLSYQKNSNISLIHHWLTNDYKSVDRTAARASPTKWGYPVCTNFESLTILKTSSFSAWESWFLTMPAQVIVLLPNVFPYHGSELQYLPRTRSLNSSLIAARLPNSTDIFIWAGGGRSLCEILIPYSGILYNSLRDLPLKSNFSIRDSEAADLRLPGQQALPLKITFNPGERLMELGRRLAQG